MNSRGPSPAGRRANASPRRSQWRRGFAHGLLASGFALAGLNPAASGQNLGAEYAMVEGVEDLARRCAGGHSGFVSPCREMSLAVMAVQQGMGLASALGSDIPGTSSTHGRRLGLMPRVGVAISASALRFGMPRVAASAPAGLTENENVMLLGLGGTAFAGVIDGFQLAPTVGGVLSVDAIASYSLMGMPTGAALSGSGSGFGVGARVGIVRESFTLPGISVAAARRWLADVQLGSTADGNPGQATTGLTVSSLRATAGKNWFVIGIMGGVGWDRYEGDVQLSVPRGAGDPGSVTGNVASERILYFVSGWFNFLLTRLSLEVGLAEGVGDPFEDRTGAFDPHGATWFASTAFRITL